MLLDDRIQVFHTKVIDTKSYLPEYSVALLSKLPDIGVDVTRV